MPYLYMFFLCVYNQYLQFSKFPIFRNIWIYPNRFFCVSQIRDSSKFIQYSTKKGSFSSIPIIQNYKYYDRYYTIYYTRLQWFNNNDNLKKVNFDCFQCFLCLRFLEEQWIWVCLRCVYLLYVNIPCYSQLHN